MNGYTFVAHPNNNPIQKQNKISPSILQRLQQLKQSMRPSQPIEHKYESTNTNKNLALNLSNVKNQRLNRYLPNQADSKTKTNNEEAEQQFESYRKSLQKKLNYLFQKQKQIMKTQSTFQPYQHNFRYQGNSQYQNDLERKYDQFQAQQFEQLNANRKQKSNTLIGRDTKSFSNLQSHNHQAERIPQERRQIRAFSTIEYANFHKSIHYKDKKDQQIDQMQRKIKILQMKYLGKSTLSPQKVYQKQFSKNQNLGNYQRQQQNEIGLQYHSKSKKPINKKANTSPDNLKTKTKNKQTIDTNYHKCHQHFNQQSMKDLRLNKSGNKKILKQSLQFQQQRSKKKQRIKDYMSTLENYKGQQNAQILTQKEQQKLKEQFIQLKQQFQYLLQLNKSVLQKVECNEEQNKKKREKKLRAKAMLKQILLRLEEIKQQIKSKANHRDIDYCEDQNTRSQRKIQNKSLVKTRQKGKNQHAVFQKSIDWANSEQKRLQQHLKQPINREKITKNRQQQKIISPQNQSSQINITKDENKKQDIDRLKMLLELQIQHRNIVQKKLEVIYDQNNFNFHPKEQQKQQPKS